MTDDEIITTIRDELGEWMAQKLKQGMSIAQVSVGILEIGCVTALMSGLNTKQLARIMPNLIKTSEIIVNETREHARQIQ